jgi:pyrroloquinoline-quinone synthase
MSSADLNTVLAAALADRRLLDHPFYRRWERGEVLTTELAAYAAQYRYFEAYLPTFLATVVASLPEGAGRDLVAANLADEEGDPVPHIELFETFAEAVGATAEKALPATAQLVGTYERLLGHGPLEALAGFVAYESQSSDIAARKAEGLRRHHGLNDRDVSFWEHHAAVDARHGGWLQEAIDEYTEDPLDLAPFVRQGADAWWAFLDERDAVAHRAPRSSESNSPVS